MAKMIIKGFEFLLTDRDEFERLLLQVRWGDIVLFELNKERGDDQAEMKLYCNDVLYNDREIKFPLADFMEVMRIAQEQLALL